MKHQVKNNDSLKIEYLLIKNTFRKSLLGAVSLLAIAVSAKDGSKVKYAQSEIINAEIQQKEVFINDQYRGQGIKDAITASGLVSKKNVLVATVLSDDPKFLKMVVDVMNTNIADGRRRVMIVHGDAPESGFSKVDLWANGKRGDSYIFTGQDLDDTGLKLYKSTKEIYKNRIVKE